MLDSLGQFGGALAHLLSGWGVLNVFWATLLGIIIGALPGLTATMGVALMTTLTFTMPHEQAILVLVCIYVGAFYGGSRSAILLNIPGTPASACSTLDGFPLARQGLAGRAMGISTSGSWLGTLFGILCVAALTPVLSEIALKFQSFEFFWIAVFGIVIAGTLAGGVAEVLQAMRGPAVQAVSSKIDSVIPRLEDVFQYWRTILRSGAIGTFIGILPGLGEDTAAWSSYAAARRASKEKEKYGKGSIEGLMAAETGESACVPGAIIPVLTLAVPGSAPAAVLMAAMLIHGLNPGPNLMLQTPEFFYQIVAMLLIADMSKLFFGLTLVRPLLWILLVPRERLMPVVFVLCVVGAYAITSRVFDIYVMLFFGVLGFVLRELKFPMAPLILGLVLGDLLEKNLTRGLVLSGGDITPFFTRPISGVLAAITIA